MASLEPSQACPSISIHISTTAPVLDLSLATSFTINVTTILNASHPITIKMSLTPIFNRLLYKDGLTFRNTRTGEYVPRPTMRVCFDFSKDNGLPTEKYKEHWKTLYPDEPHVRKATFEPTLTTAPIVATLGMTATEMKEIQSRQPVVTKWRYVRGLEDGQTYEIGISEGLGVKEWVRGSLEGILEMREAGTTPELLTEKIPFEIIHGTRFTVKRPDSDESLNWPGP